MSCVELRITECFQIKFLIVTGNPNDTIVGDGGRALQALVVRVVVRLGRASQRRVPEKVEVAMVGVIHQHYTFRRTLENDELPLLLTTSVYKIVLINYTKTWIKINITKNITLISLHFKLNMFYDFVLK
jgi:hypothetical protein